LILITKGSSRGATLSFTSRSKGEVGYFRYLIIQEIASYFSTFPPLYASYTPEEQTQNIVIYNNFDFFGLKNHILLYGEISVNTSIFARCWLKTTVNTVLFAIGGKKHHKYRGFGLPIRSIQYIGIYGVFFSVFTNVLNGSDRKPKTTVFMMFFASNSKKYGIYSGF
jgi:hypothetical protein